MNGAYDIGDQVRLTAQFQDEAGALIDPESVVLQIRDGAGAQTTYTYPGPGVAHDGIGQYHYDLTLTVGGTWVYRWEGTGHPQTAEEGQLAVRPSQVATGVTAASPTDPCALLAQAQAQLALLLSGRAVVSVETPQLGRVEFSRANAADLQRMIVTLADQCAAASGAPRLRRRPISLEACP